MLELPRRREARMKALRSLRRARALNQAGLALLAGITQREVSHLERGTRHGRAATWRKIAAVLGVHA